jgi:hypothetical protein
VPTPTDGRGARGRPRRALRRSSPARIGVDAPVVGVRAGGTPTNERLEFLGDAVLGLVVTDEIYSAHPDEQEGRLAKLRAAAVRVRVPRRGRAGPALGEYIRLGRGEMASGGADKDSILGDALEAVIGAVYLDQGFATAYDLVQRLFAEVSVEVAASHRAGLQDEPAGARRRPVRGASALRGHRRGPGSRQDLHRRGPRRRGTARPVGRGPQQEGGRAAGRARGAPGSLTATDGRIEGRLQ